MAVAAETQSEIQIRRLLDAEHVKVRSLLGKGSYSTVNLGYSESLKRKIAIKIIDKRTRSEYVRRFMPRELLLVRSLNHPNIVRVHNVIEVPEFVCVIEEVAENGDLLQRIKKLRHVPEGSARGIFRQLFEALHYLHGMEIIHRDLKCENIFLDRHDNVKLGDFGFARRLGAGEWSTTFCGSRAYVAPEILSGKRYTGHATDLWSAGVVIYVTVTGVMPYDDREPRKMLERMTQHRIRFPRMTLSLEVRTLIFDLMHPDPTRRPDYSAVVRSPWLSATPYVMAGPAHSTDSTTSLTSSVTSRTPVKAA